MAAFSGSIADSKKENQSKGLDSLLRIGKGAFDVATGNWLGLAGDVLGSSSGQMVQSVGDAYQKFMAWKNGGAGPRAFSDTKSQNLSGGYSGPEKRW